MRIKLISALLLLAGFSFASSARAQTGTGGQATPIRSTTTLPATCQAGTGTLPADLINMGGDLYLCTATNVWTGVPQKNVANTWTQKQTFSADPLFGSAVPWTDVRTNGSVCDGSTDATTGYTTTIIAIATLGGTAFLRDNCKITPPSSMPAAATYFSHIGLGGQLNLTSTLHVGGPTNYSGQYQIDCQNPGLRAPHTLASPPVALYLLCPIQPDSGFTVGTPLLSVESNAFVLKDLSISTECGSTLKIFPNGGDEGIVDNVWSSGANCTGQASGGVEHNSGFGVWYKGGGFTSSVSGTQPSMWFHANGLNNDPPGSIMTVDHSFIEQHGVRFDSVPGSVGTISGYGTNMRFIQQLYEDANAHNLIPPDENSAMYTYDIANCSYTRILIDTPEVADSNGLVPLVNVENSLTGAGLVNGQVGSLSVVNSNNNLIHVTPYAGEGDRTSIAGVSVIGGPALEGLYGANCYYSAYTALYQSNCAAGNVPSDDIAGHVIGMTFPELHGATCVASTTGGSLPTGTYYLMPVAVGVNISGATAESVPGGELVVLLTGPTGSITCSSAQLINSPGSTTTRWYVGTSTLAENTYYSFSDPSYADTITGSGGTSGTPQQLQSNPNTMAVTDYLNGTGPGILGRAGCIGIGSACVGGVPGDLALGIGGFQGLLTHANTGNRTYTLPDASGTLLTGSGTGIVAETAPGVTVPRTITAGLGMQCTNGNGVAGNPTCGITASQDTRSFQWTQGNIAAPAVLTTAIIQPQPLFEIPVASTLLEVDVFVDAGESTVQLGFWHGRTSTALTPVLTPVTVAGVHYNVACANVGATTTTIQGTVVTCSALTSSAMAAKDFVSTIGGAADGTSSFISVTGIYSVN